MSNSRFLANDDKLRHLYYSDVVSSIVITCPNCTDEVAVVWAKKHKIVNNLTEVYIVCWVCFDEQFVASGFSCILSLR
jgi:hypothetical protein